MQGNIMIDKNKTPEENKAKIVKNWLPRYTGMELDKFGKYILLVNFKHYIQSVAEHYGVKIYGEDKAMFKIECERKMKKINGTAANISP